MAQSKRKTALTKTMIAAVACCAGALLSIPSAQAQDASPPAAAPTTTTAPAATPAAAPAAAPSVWSVGGIDFSGLVDGYYNFNANHPPDSTNGNQLHNFDYDSNTFSLNMAKLTMSHDPDPVGFRIDLGFGKAFNEILSTEPNFKHLEQAFVSWKPTKGKGFEADFGEFVTSAGAEVIETKDNWNYSRSLLFSLAIPYYHVGLRTSMPVTKNFTAGVQVVNGWNNFSDNNSGKTIGLTGVYTKPKYTLSTNYYVGPENNNTNKGYRNLLDATLLLTPTPKVSAYINYDYGQNRNAGAIDSTVASPQYETTDLAHWQGVAAALHYQATSKIAFTPRFEYYKDESGFTTGTTQNVNEFTLTGEYKMPEGLLARLEFRRDDSDQPYFVKGSRLVDAQSTLEVGVVAFFGPKR
jgi:hypothetical protein